MMKLAKSWSEVTIKQFLSIQNLYSNMDLDVLDKEITVLSLLSDKPVEYFENLEIEKFREHLKQIEWTKSIDTISTKIPMDFRVDGVRYVVTYKVDNLKAGQFIDLQTFTKDNSKINDNIHNIMAVMCLPEREKYSGLKHSARAELFMQKLTIDIAYPLCVFFCKLWKESLPLIADYLTGEALKQTAKATALLKDLEGIGAG